MKHYCLNVKELTLSETGLESATQALPTDEHEQGLYYFSKDFSGLNVAMLSFEHSVRSYMFSISKWRDQGGPSEARRKEHQKGLIDELLRNCKTTPNRFGV